MPETKRVVNAIRWARLQRRAGNVARRTRDRVRDRFQSSYGAPPDGELARLADGFESAPQSHADARAVRHFLDHRFDLLGSGWVQVRYGMRCVGFEGVRFDHAAAGLSVNDANAGAADAIRRMLTPQYRAIDWQLDFRSGFRWCESTWHRDVRYGDIAGADVKAPWELSRMQHLPELAVAYAGTREPALVTELCDQVLDWIAANPPRFGVNWVCTMDAGIRVANWLLAFDLMRAAGASFSPSFERVFAASVLDHARHIASNLEWSETRRGNHYLGNIAGLLFAAAYLPANAQTDAWLAFAAQELSVETDRQFLADGGHFEASTSYHNLCAEIVTVCASVLAALPAARIAGLFTTAPAQMQSGPTLAPATPMQLRRCYESSGTLLPAPFYEKVVLSARFARAHTRHDRSPVQVGDNDSGRFVRFGGWTEQGSVAHARERYANLSGFHELPDDDVYLMQSCSSHQQWLAWASAVTGDQQLSDLARHADLAPASSVARAFARAPMRVSGTSAMREQAPRASRPQTDGVHRTHQVSGVHRAAGSDLLHNATCEAFPDFGAYVVRSDRLHLVIRCGFACHDGAGVHAHEDQLAFDLTIDGEAVARDPGAYIYTPSKEWRNRYRAAGAHWAPAANEPAELTRAVFSGPRNDDAECLGFGPDGFVGRTRFTSGGWVLRRIRWYDDRIEIHDEYALPPPFEPAAADPFAPAAPVPYSPGYGVRLK